MCRTGGSRIAEISSLNLRASWKKPVRWWPDQSDSFADATFMFLSPLGSLLTFTAKIFIAFFYFFWITEASSSQLRVHMFFFGTFWTKFCRIPCKFCIEINGCWRKLTWVLLKSAGVHRSKTHFLVPRAFVMLLYSAKMETSVSKRSLFRCSHQYLPTSCVCTVSSSELEVSARWLSPFETHPKNWSRHDAVFSFCIISNTQQNNLCVSECAHMSSMTIMGTENNFTANYKFNCKLKPYFSILFIIFLHFNQTHTYRQTNTHILSSNYAVVQHC